MPALKFWQTALSVRPPLEAPLPLEPLAELFPPPLGCEGGGCVGWEFGPDLLLNPVRLAGTSRVAPADNSECAGASRERNRMHLSLTSAVQKASSREAAPKTASQGDDGSNENPGGV